jgi:hypothetical protein
MYIYIRGYYRLEKLFMNQITFVFQKSFTGLLKKKTHNVIGIFELSKLTLLQQISQYYLYSSHELISISSPGSFIF